MSPSEHLEAFINGPIIKNDPTLKDLLLKAEELPNAALVVHNFIRQTNEYMGPYLETLTGHSQSDVIKGGIPMLVQLCSPDEILQLASAQASYVQQTKSINFDPRSFHLHLYNWTLNHRLGHKEHVMGLGIILSYTAMGDLEFGAGFLIKTTAESAAMEACKLLLHKIKDRHNEIYIHPVRPSLAIPYQLNYLTNVDQISPREREVLGMLAKGKNTNTIAVQLGITANTVESHRKNLLEKFKCGNSAELIKKASKVFWLD